MYKLYNIFSIVVRQNLEEGYYFHPISFLLVVVFSIALYFAVACMDPGYVKQGEPDVKEVRIFVLILV